MSEHGDPSLLPSPILHGLPRRCASFLEQTEEEDGHKSRRYSLGNMGYRDNHVQCPCAVSCRIRAARNDWDSEQFTIETTLPPATLLRNRFRTWYAHPPFFLNPLRCSDMTTSYANPRTAAYRAFLTTKRSSPQTKKLLKTEPGNSAVEILGAISRLLSSNHFQIIPIR